jgi:tRNA G18 (ribose-2'-O)-methylase SpoU
MRGYFGIGVENIKTGSNIGSLWRSANIFGASFIFTVNRRYSRQISDTLSTPKHIPLTHYEKFDDFYKHLPSGCQLIGVELVEASENLIHFTHPQRAVYLLGAEDTGLSSQALKHCHRIIQIPTVNEVCLNVANAGSIILYDRLYKSKLYK